MARLVTSGVLEFESLLLSYIVDSEKPGLARLNRLRIYCLSTMFGRLARIIARELHTEQLLKKAS